MTVEVGTAARPAWDQVPAALRGGVAGRLGGGVTAAVTQASGFTPGLAVRLTVSGGDRVFVKALPVGHPMAATYRTEAYACRWLPERAPVPRLRWTDDIAGWVVLVFDDAGGRLPDLRPGSNDVVATVEALTSLYHVLTPCPVPNALPASQVLGSVVSGWAALASGPPADLDGWARRNLDRLAAIERNWVAAAAHVDQAQVNAFLDHLETERGNSVATRNLRLAAIKAMMAFLATKAPEQLDTVARIHAIPAKKRDKSHVTFLTPPQVQALLDAIDADTWTGRRDRAMFTLAAQTGLRLSEITALSIGSVHLGAAAHVACTGKGRKQRTTPLTSATASALRTYLDERVTRPGQALFPNPHRQALSVDAVQRRLAVHLANATTTCPELVGKQVTVHTLRHTAAMRFLDAGIDSAVIALWLGHESTATTSVYLHADMGIKRAALDRTRQPDTPAGDYHPTDPLLAWLQSL